MKSQYQIGTSSERHTTAQYQRTSVPVPAEVGFLADSKLPSFTAPIFHVSTDSTYRSNGVPSAFIIGTTPNSRAVSTHYPAKSSAGRKAPGLSPDARVHQKG